MYIQAALTYSTTNTPMYNSTEFPQGITNGADWYIALGSLQDWVYAYNGCMDVTVELGNTKWPSSSTLPTYWEQNQESLTAYLEFVHKGLHGTVTNAQGAPLHATIHLNTPGIDIKTDPQVGDYHRILLTGNYTVTASCPGYQSSTVNVVIPPSGSAIHNFVLSAIQMTDMNGTVVNGSGIPIPSAIVKLKLFDNVIQTQTNTNGVFSFSNIQQDDYTLIITAQGYGVYNRPFTLNQSSHESIIVMTEPLFTEGFDNGLTNWTVQSPWAIVNQNANNVLADSPAGNYGNNLTLDAKLTNPISLQNIDAPTLSFDIKYNLENNYDYLYVSGSTNGTNWNTLGQFTGNSENWTNVVLSLDGYAGSNFYLRFRLTSDYSQNADGVYIDNVVVSGFSTQQAVYGDVDANRLININDVKHILEYCVGNNPIPLIDTYPWEAYRLEAADVDNDNQITATDAYYLYHILQAGVSPLPAQGGGALTFNNPELSISHSETVLTLSFNQPQSLRSLMLNFSSLDNLTISDVDWDVMDSDILTAVNSTNDRLGLIVLTNGLSQSNVANLLYSTNANTIKVEGLINDITTDLDVIITSNNDNNNSTMPTTLIGCYPNPFNPKTTINLSISDNNTKASIVVFNIRGQVVRNLLNKSLSKGNHRIVFDGRDDSGNTLGSGIYFFQLSASGKSQTKKMILVK
jgi:hypothetical protein